MLKKHIISPLVQKAVAHHPGLRFVKEYSPKTFERINVLDKIMNYVAECDVEGDYLEFGVFRAKTFANAIAKANKERLTKMHFYAFDSFRGLPKPEGIDTHSEQFAEGEYSAGLEEFKSRLKEKNVDFSRVHIIPGWFKDTLNEQTKKELPMKTAAVVWVDCDYYDSTVPVLDFITDYIVDGTMLVLDDWFFYKGHPGRGEQKAFSEWMAKNPQFSATEYHKYAWHGNSFIINIKDA